MDEEEEEDAVGSSFAEEQRRRAESLLSRHVPAFRLRAGNYFLAYEIADGDPASSDPIGFTGNAVVTLNGVVYAPAVPVNIDGNANVTINLSSGTATKPPILGALIAYDLTVASNGVLTINPDVPTVGNAGFELPSLGTGFFAYRYGNGGGGNPGTLTLADQGGSGWTFSTTAGIAANGSGSCGPSSCRSCMYNPRA